MDSQLVENAHPYARLFAFLFDLSLFFFPFEMAWILFDPVFYLRAASGYMGLPQSLVQSFTALPLIALSLWLFRNTPGKALLGFAVLRDESLPPAGFTEWYKRTIDSFWRGAGGTLPYIMAAMLFLGGRRLMATGQTPWDERLHTMVRHRGFTPPKTTVFILLFALSQSVKYVFLMTELAATAPA